MTGYLDPERFTSEVPSHLACEICLGALVEPLEHTGCDTAFCGSCVQTWSEGSHSRYASCPHCRARVAPSDWRPLHRVLRAQLEGLTLRCENYPRCKEVLSVGGINKHMKSSCPFSEHDCKIPGCNVTFTSSSRAEHMQHHAGEHVDLLVAALHKMETAEKFDCEAPVNSEGRPQKLGTKPGCLAKLYCKRGLGRGAIGPDSDGYCGPNDGPQCQSCSETKIVNARGHEVKPGRGEGRDKLYCGREYNIPRTDGRCGPSNGPQCKYCKFLQEQALSRYRDDILISELLVDIGTFAQHEHSPGREFLSSSPASFSAPSPQCIEDLLSSEPAANLAADFTWLPGPVLQQNARGKLMKYLDLRAERCSSTPAELEDLKVTLSEGELRTIIGDTPLNQLKEVPGFPSDFTSIRLRRCQAASHCINFHLDVSLRTMQVALNSDSEYTGGALVYVNQEGLHCPSRPAGSATIHSADIMHGVTELVEGIRYGLFFLTEAAH